MRTFLLIVSLAAAVLTTGGCFEAPPAATPPTTEYQFAIPDGQTTEGGPELLSEIEHLVESSSIGTPITFFLASNQQELGSLVIPEGPPKYRRRITRENLKKVYERFDAEWVGTAQEVDLLSISRTSRSLRKNHDLELKLVICGSPLIKDSQSGEGIDNEQIWCCGSLDDPTSPFGKMPSFSPNTTTYWLLDRPDYGAGPSHRAEIEHFIRYVLDKKGAPLIRMGSSAKSLLRSTNSQWEDTPEAADDCSGLKPLTVFEAKIVDPTEQTTVLVLKPDMSIVVRPPVESLLNGSSERIAFLLDTSGSMSLDASENDVSHDRIVPARKDVCRKIQEMKCDQLLVIGFGGDQSGKQRLVSYPVDWLGNKKWAKSTPENRQSMVEAVQAMECGGGTPTLPALRSLVNMKEPPTLVVLFSDGAPTLEGNMTETIQFAVDELAPAGITLHTVGVGALSAESDAFDYSGGVFLTRLARATGGDYFALAAQTQEEKE